MALYSLYCADVPLRNCTSLTSIWASWLANCLKFLLGLPKGGKGYPWLFIGIMCFNFSTVILWSNYIYWINILMFILGRLEHQFRTGLFHPLCFFSTPNLRGLSADRRETVPHDRKLAEFYNASPKIPGAPPPQKKWGPNNLKFRSIVYQFRLLCAVDSKSSFSSETFCPLL